MTDMLPMAAVSRREMGANMALATGQRTWQQLRFPRCVVYCRSAQPVHDCCSLRAGVLNDAVALIGLEFKAEGGSRTEAEPMDHPSR